MKKLHRLIALILMSSILLTGCWDQLVFEQVGFILTLGIEEGEDGKLLASIVFPAIDAKEKNAVRIEVTDSSLLRGVRENVRYVSDKFVEGGKIQQILICENIARKGVQDILEIFQRSVALPSIAYVVVTEGSALELLKATSENENIPLVSFYIHRLIDNNIKISNIPNTKVFDFNINYFAPGLDPVVPMIRKGEEGAEVIGCALFSDDKMTGKLDEDHTILLLDLMGQAKSTDYVIMDKELPSDNPGKYGVAVRLRKPKRKIAISFNDEGIPIINISMKYKCSLAEYRWDKTDDEKVQMKLEGVIKENLIKAMNEVIAALQEANCDSIGFGDMIRAKYNDYWKTIDWKEVYPKAEIKVDVSVEITNEGLIK